MGKRTWTTEQEECLKELYLQKKPIKEIDIENQIITLLNEILEYDSVVNNFFLPLVKDKLII